MMSLVCEIKINFSPAAFLGLIKSNVNCVKNDLASFVSIGKYKTPRLKVTLNDFPEISILSLQLFGKCPHQ